MSDILLETHTKTRWRPTYFVWMALLVVFFAFGGFGVTYLYPMAEGTFKGVRPAVHIHGILFFTWTLFLLWQTSLVAAGNRALHRSLGMVGISLATAVVLFGFIVSMQAEGKMIASGYVALGYWWAFADVTAMTAFGAMVAMGIKDLHRLDYHKRWMLMATTNILFAATNRILASLFDGDAPPLLSYLAVGSIPATCLIYDIRTRGRPHIVTIIGGAVLAYTYLGVTYLSVTQTWHNLYDSLLLLLAST